MSTPIRALENAVRKTKSSGQEKPEFDEKAQNTTKLLLQLEDKPEVEKDIYELIHELAVIAKKHNWQEVERHWHNLLAIVQRVSRRGELKKPSSEEEFKKNLWWMSERGTKEDLPLLQKLKQSPPYPKSEVSDLIETVIGTIKKKVERSNAMNLDPRLQKLIFDVKRGTTKLPTSSTDTNEVAVIAKVSDLAAWENLSEVRPGAKIEADDGDYLVSGRIPILRIENVRSQPFVKSLKAAQKLSPTLHKTTEETMSRADLLPEGNLANGGKGVVVGIIDFGCDFVHKNFRNADGTTRLLALWDQSSSAQHNSPFGYGRVYTQEKINEALKNSDPYTHLGYQPPHDTILEAAGSHGTHVTDIAAGNGLGSSVPGVAPDADIIFVELTNTLPDDEEKRAEKLTETSFGDTVQLFEAVQFIFEQAGDRPCVVNISLGTHGGPHDGTTLVEQILDGSVKELPNRAIVIAAGNLSDDEVHTSGVVPEGGSADLEWHIPESNADENELELWYSGEDRFSLDLIDPSGEKLLTVEPGKPSTFEKGGNLIIFAVNRLTDPNNRNNQIGIWFSKNRPTGTWTVRLQGNRVKYGWFHAWVERENPFTQSKFLNSDSNHTLGSISCGYETIAVGSYDAHKNTTPISYFSSSGPTLDGRQKPEISAPGHYVLAAHSRTGTRVTRKSGTSMAAPAVAGIVALMLAEAKARGMNLSNSQIRQILMDSARKNPPSGGWHEQYGYGRVSAHAAVEAVIKLTT